MNGVILDRITSGPKIPKDLGSIYDLVVVSPSGVSSCFKEFWICERSTLTFDFKNPWIRFEKLKSLNELFFFGGGVLGAFTDKYQWLNQGGGSSSS